MLYFSTWFLLLLAVSYRVYRINVKQLYFVNVKVKLVHREPPRVPGAM